MDFLTLFIVTWSCALTPEANADNTQESYFQLQIFPGGDAVFLGNLEVAAVMGRFWEN